LIIPHCMLFDSTGACLYRGAANDDLETKMRAAVGKALVKSLGKDSFSKSVMPLVQALDKGQPPLTVLHKVRPLERSTDPATAEDAKLVAGKLAEAGQKQVEDAEAIMKTDPIAAYDGLQRVPITFKGTPQAAKANTLLAELRKDKSVAGELRLRLSLEALRQLDARLSATGLDPMSAQFKRSAGLPLQQMKNALQDMKKTAPDSPATQEALTIGSKYGIDVP